MTRVLMAALIATGMGVSSAAADSVIIYDESLGDKFEIKRAVVELAEEIYGQTAVYDSGQLIPLSVAGQLVAGEPLPEGAETSAVPEELAGRLPHSEPDTNWVQLGEHLIELRSDGTVVMGIYDVLPASAS